MAAFIDISALGVPELAEKLNQFENREAKRAMRKALRAGAELLWRRIIPHIPVDEGDLKFGMLDKRKTIRPFSNRRRGFGFRVQTPTRDVLGIPANDDSYYPAVVEYGRKDGSMAPRSFMRGPTEASRGEVLAEVKRVLGPAIEAEVTKLATKRARVTGRG